jgi:hypothetical protein
MSSSSRKGQAETRPAYRRGDLLVFSLREEDNDLPEKALHTCEGDRALPYLYEVAAGVE